jgi:hypothetical protein
MQRLLDLITAGFTVQNGTTGKESLHNAVEPSKLCPKVLEIGFQPLLKNAFPDSVTFIDTRLRWSDVHTYQVNQASLSVKIKRLASSFMHAMRLALTQDYDAVVTRCLGPVNSYGRPWWTYFVGRSIGWALERLVLFAARGSRVCLVVLDQTDHSTIHPRDLRLARASDLYFKRELADNLWHSLESILPRGASAGTTSQSPLGVSLCLKLRPLPLGIDESAIGQPVPSAEKRYDIYYSGTSSHIPVREDLIGILVALEQRGWRVFAPQTRLTFEEFRTAVRQSRLCLSPSGIGWDCYRHYEVLAFGSVPAMNFRPVRSIAPLRHGRECFYFDPQDDLITQIEGWLNLSNERLDEIIASAQQRLRSYYTLDAIARYIMGEITAAVAAKSLGKL